MCVFLSQDNVFEVGLLKNSSGLGFSFSREESPPDQPAGSSMVRVKKLFPGQPAAESGLIDVGDVILRVNQTPLRGLSQHVRSSQRRNPPLRREVCTFAKLRVAWVPAVLIGCPCVRR